MSDGSRQGILSLTIKDKAVLYAAYMPFLRTAGYLCLPTSSTASGMRFLCCSP